MMDSPQNLSNLERRITKIETIFENRDKNDETIRRHVQEGRDKMQRDIDELKTGHATLHEKIDNGFNEIKVLMGKNRDEVKTMINEDRIKSGELKGATAMANKLIGWVIGAASAIVSFWIYVTSNGHK